MGGAVLIGLVVLVPLCGFVWFIWKMTGRPLAVTLGLIKPNAHDFVVRGWKAERGGEWMAALAAYDKARSLKLWDGDVEVRRADLVQRCPELAGEAEVTEREMWEALDPLEVLEHPRARASDRKLRLVAVACCRQAWHLLSNDRSRLLVEGVEKYADQPQLLYPEEWMNFELAAQHSAGLISTFNNMSDALEAAEQDVRNAQTAAAMSLAWWSPRSGATLAIRLTASAIGRRNQLRLLDCLFGLSLLTREAVPSWLTSTVLALAEGIYEEKAFDCMPMLADALMDAGCENEDILSHCRSDCTHVKGCWVVDLLLAKD